MLLIISATLFALKSHKTATKKQEEILELWCYTAEINRIDLDEQIMLLPYYKGLGKEFKEMKKYQLTRGRDRWVKLYDDCCTGEKNCDINPWEGIIMS